MWYSRVSDANLIFEASLYTSDISRALSVASKLEAGSISINSAFFPNNSVPFGGWKMSGSGKELGKDGLMEYMKTQAILVKYVALEY
jgi:aldehyde dehydrogenase (NAD+)